MRSITRSRAAICAAGAIVAAIEAGAAQADPGFDPKQCSRIEDVQVPFDVAVSGDTLRFSGRSVITVTPARITVGGRAFSDAALIAPLHRDLKAFLANAGDFASAMGPIAIFFGAAVPSQARDRSDASRPESTGFIASITGLCRAVLAVEASERSVKAAFAEFTPPVEVRLSRE